ncbi:MAG: tRNA (adenosine(37)-N6)-threonylcarbamoyltransferase complex dimerization subunit type 1 TsaB [Firmicutes bacterium]|nr:tRNA (adenosine(37)-N6)-threonylcarbamoyltransferase complex dimerization subunit type 1 TsaB [Bacillota bacterium]MDD4264015.1 tRNA (adenosine(37)-N6)-threonylcarbamoyltransferase complex dimerization subunit type 1 TsaB [Bacillota bacterium]MDD4694078.1 tRNA (adenosine(37)-N6)-threonylcarbamoyltransferase complex dimerization subunit type 1 TsaB [Bacillota bacterium]
MLCLALDTSTKTGGAALVDGESILGEYVLDIERKTHSERVVPAIDYLLKGLGVKIDEIDSLAIAHGPGSFTGLRIGVATVKALSLSLDLPVYKVDTLEALASQISFLDGVIIPILSARRGEVYGAIWKSKPAEDSFICLKKSGARSLESLLESVPQENNLYFLGEGALSEKESILQAFPDATIVRGTNSMLHPGSVGLRALKTGSPVDIDSLLPNYLRKSEAEIKKGL